METPHLYYAQTAEWSSCHFNLGSFDEPFTVTIKFSPAIPATSLMAQAKVMGVIADILAKTLDRSQSAAD